MNEKANQELQKYLQKGNRDTLDEIESRTDDLISQGADIRTIDANYFIERVKVSDPAQLFPNTALTDVLGMLEDRGYFANAEQSAEAFGDLHYANKQREDALRIEAELATQRPDSLVLETENYTYYDHQNEDAFDAEHRKARNMPLEKAIEKAENPVTRQNGFGAIVNAIYNGAQADQRYYHDDEEYSDIPGDPYVLAVSRIPGSEKVLTFMLNRGADVNAEGPDSGETLMHWARTPEFVDHLKEQGFKYDAPRDAYGQTPLARAILNDDMEMAQKHMDIGEDPAKAFGRSATCLDKAKSVGMIDKLVENGVDPNQRDEFGKTALHNLPHRSRDMSLATRLLEHRADPKIRDCSGKEASKAFEREDLGDQFKNVVQTVQYRQTKEREHERDRSPSFSR